MTGNQNTENVEPIHPDDVDGHRAFRNGLLPEPATEGADVEGHGRMSGRVRPDEEDVFSTDTRGRVTRDRCTPRPHSRADDDTEGHKMGKG
jgi:hypothetical protein